MQKLSYLQEKKFPFITFGQTELSTPHAFADIDNYDLGYRGATYLYSHGCKNIVMTASSVDYTYTNHKYFGVKRASMEYGIDFDREKQTIYDYQISSNYRKLRIPAFIKLKS